MPLPPGAVIGNRYTVQQQLGAGGGGDAYLVHDAHENDVAVLKLLTALRPGAEWIEAEALRHLADEHILPIRNADVDSGQRYIVTAFAQHGTVEGLIQNTSGCGMDVGRVVTLIRDACHGIDRAHRARLLHNDIKPPNLFLNDQGECLVGDFGSASLIPVGETTTVPGGATPAIAAPEVAAGIGTAASTASVRSDIYSLGATADWCLAGERAYAFPPATNLQERFAIVAAGPPPHSLRDRAPHIPLGVAKAVERAMSRDPANRFATVLEFAHALGARPAASRKWQRTNQHAGHIGCWRGEPRDGGSTYILCVEQTTQPGRLDITTRHATSNSRVTAGCRSAVTEAGCASALRGIIKKL
ncbi:MAG TPA: serine/threonine-protein kinase [Solirubrobacteraceae bacterium]|jgi:serine/threonine-protein kinase|nr:serine/threonine-protein kinase [Solirubrobacteraceae bacterium]